MSQAPYALRDARFGTRLGVDLKLEDTLWAGLTDQYIKMPMGITAENLAAKYGLTMDDTNAYAVQTQQRWGAANEAGHFDAEICPVELKKVFLGDVLFSLKSYEIIFSEVVLKLKKQAFNTN